MRKSWNYFLNETVLGKSLKLFLYQIRYQHFKDPFKDLQSEKPLYILGNGPSLKEISSQIDRDKVDLCAVNDSIITDLYLELKPDIHLFIDPLYFMVNGRDSNVDNVEKILYVIENVISWPLTILLPFSASKHFIKRCIVNKNIKLLFFNPSHWLPMRNSFVYFLYNHNYAMPKPQNVMIAAIYSAIRLGYKEINLCGVEHSWLKYTYVTDENVCCLTDEHFYGKCDRPWAFPDGKLMKYHELLLRGAITFQSYHELEEYASYKNGVSIVNRTRNSFIDAFKKIY